jgi:hypothetical protein
MTKVEDNPTYIKKGLLSSDRLVFAVICATIIGVIVETGIIRVSGFEAEVDVSTDVIIFIGLGIFSVFSQLIILNFVRNKFGKSFLSRNHVRARHKQSDANSSIRNYRITNYSLIGSFTYF